MARNGSSTHISASDLPTRLPETDEEMAALENGEDPTRTGRNASKYSTTELRGISSFAEAKRLAEEKFGGVVDASDEMGNGFTVLNGKDKDKLLGEDFIILSIDFNEGDQGPFVSFLAVDADNRKFVVNDGGTGIYSQLDEYVNVRGGEPGGLFVHGLRKSEYDNPHGEGRSTTYYLNI